MVIVCTYITLGIRACLHLQGSNVPALLYCLMNAALQVGQDAHNNHRVPFTYR